MSALGHHIPAQQIRKIDNSDQILSSNVYLFLEFHFPSLLVFLLVLLTKKKKNICDCNYIYHN